MCRKREEGKRRVFALNADQLAGPGSVCVRVCVCACVRALSLVTEHRPIWRSQTTQLVFLAPQEKKKQNFPLLRIQS